METAQEISIKTEIENEPTIDLKVDEENKTGEKECEQDAVIKEPKIQIQSLYCYSCHQHFESLSLFKSHRHGDEEEDKENCCLDLDLDGLSVTCHKCDAQFLSLRLFLDHLYRKNKSKRRKILDNSNLNSDWQSTIPNVGTCNNNNEENLIETDEEINIDHHNNNSNSSADFSGSENNYNSDNEPGNDPEFDPLDVDEDFNLNRGTEDEDEVSVQSDYENEEENDESDDEEFSPTKSKLRKKSKRPSKKNSNKKKKKIIKNDSGSEEEQIEMENVKEDESDSGSGKKLIKTRKKKLSSDENKEESVKNNKPISCPICDKKYTYKYALHRHVREVHSSESFNIHLDNRTREEIDADNDMEFKNEKRRKERRLVRVKCPEEGCGKILSCAQALRYHRVVHLKKQEKPIETEVAVVCKYCGKVFPLKSNLRQHIRQLHEIHKPILCDQCAMTFLTRSQLKEHSRIHTRERPYLCTQCPLTFSHLSALKRHMLTHGDRNYKCDFEGCGKAFRIRPTLLRHQRQHTGLRPYKCKFQFPDGKFCTASYIDNKPLKMHYAQAHPDFSFARVQHENKAEPISTPDSFSQQQQP